MTTRSPAFASLERAFFQYLCEVRALSPVSVAKHIYHFRRFRDFLRTKRVVAARRVSLEHAYAFFEYLACTNGRKSMAIIHWHIRDIYRFLHFKQILAGNAVDHMMTPRSWRLSRLPKGFSEDELACMFTHLRSETPRDHRELMMMMLLICYGLRRSELTRINTNDINWRDNTITIHERKNRIPLVLPLLPPVGEAITGYLEHFRPKGLKTRRLLVTIYAGKCAPAMPHLVDDVVGRFLRRCGIKGASGRFRHTLATRLINAGVDLPTIQGLLGHRHSDSTLIYAKVHWEALREVAENSSRRL
jgi:site-specific recombinase XerD